MNQAALTPRPAASMSRQGRISSGMQLVCWVAVLSVIVLLRDLFSVSFPDIVVSGLCALAFFFLDVGSGIGFFIFTSALTLPGNEIRIFYVVIMLLKLHHSRKLRLHSGMLLLSIGLLLLQLIDTALYSTLSLNSYIYDFVTRMLMLLLPLLWYSTSISPRHYRNALLCYAWGCLLGATIVFIMAVQSKGLLYLMSGANAFTRLGYGYSEDQVGMQMSYNPNHLGTMMSLVVTIFLCLMDRRQISKLIAYPVIGYSLVIIFLTRSRTALLVVAGGAALYYWVLVIRRKQFLRGLIIFIAMLLLLVLVFTLFPGIVDATLNRFVDQEDITNGRGDLFQIHISEWLSNPWCFLFGYGIGSAYDAMNLYLALHSSITDILVCWGLTGMFIVLGILWLCYRKSRHHIPRSQRLIAYLPAIVAIVTSFAGQYISTGFPHMRACFLLLAASGLAGTPQKGQNQ